MQNRFRMQQGRDYRMQSDSTLEIFIFEEIDDWFGIAASDIARVLRENKDVAKILVHLNSPGGMVTESAAIYNQLRSHGAEVIMQVEGLAASGASIIAMAGDQINIFEGAMFMIHGAWSVTRGFAADHRATAEVLEKMGDTMADIYVARTGQSRSVIVEKMAAETWFTAKEAVEFGLADTFIEGKQMAASAANLTRFSCQWPDAVLAANNLNPIRDSAGVLIGTTRAVGLDVARLEAARSQQIPATPTASAQETDDMKSIAKALNLPEDATEAQILAVMAPQSRSIAELHRLTGEEGEAAVGVIQAWQASHGQLDELKAERKAEQLAAETKEHGELIAKGQGTRQIVPATLEYWKAQPLAALRSFLDVASPVVASAAVVPPALDGTTSDSTLLRHNGKTYAEMSGPERNALHAEDKDMWKQMSTEYRESLPGGSADSAEG